jgi:hypothetical protein
MHSSPCSVGSVSVGTPSTGSNGKSRLNCEPAPSALLTSIVPPIRSTMRLQIARPSPVPPKRRRVDSSACVNGVNSSASVSGVMPMPLSVTRSVRRGGVVGVNSTRTATRPRPCVLAAENLIALPIRLVSTWRSRVGSDHNCSGICGAMNRLMSTHWLAAIGASALHTLSMTSASTTGVRSSAMRPASIFEKSRMSSMMRSSENADSRIVRTASALCSGASSCASTSIMPITPFIGVRIS